MSHGCGDGDREQERRIADLKRQVERQAGGTITSWESNVMSGNHREEFWRYVLEFGEGQTTSLTRELTAKGLDLPEPESMNAEQLASKLWEVLGALAEIHVYLTSTDHLSDRELYTALWREVLPQETDPPPRAAGGACVVDLVGTGSETDTHLYLKYYADEGWRTIWHADFPDYQMPAHEQPPYDRDRHLPPLAGVDMSATEIRAVLGANRGH